MWCMPMRPGLRISARSFATPDSRRRRSKLLFAAGRRFRHPLRRGAEHGVLLVDLGAGTTEFVVEYNSGVQASGVLQVGFDHVCNDLSLGLDLHIDVCRKLIEEKTLQRAMQERREYMEFPSSTGRGGRFRCRRSKSSSMLGCARFSRSSDRWRQRRSARQPRRGRRPDRGRRIVRTDGADFPRGVRHVVPDRAAVRGGRCSDRA